MQVEVLDDDHLDNLQCSKCHKYLSVFPVKNHVTRDVTCGRCSNDDDDGVQSMLYELITERCLFKCINRFEGCRKLLQVDETEAHERVCVGKLFECPKCQDGTDISVLELIWHYKVRHPVSYLKKNSFEGKVPVKDVMLYIQDEVVFFILFEYDSTSNTLALDAATLTGANVRQEFVISQGSFCKLTEKKSCKSMNVFDRDSFNVTLNSVESVTVIFNLEVSKGTGLYSVSMSDLSKAKNLTVSVPHDNLFRARLMPGLKKYSEYKWTDNGTALMNGASHKIDLACSNCKMIIGLPVFRCTKSRHQICYSCRTWCSICKCLVVKSLSNDVLLEISRHLSLSCKWKCGGYFGTSDLRAHEGICKLGIKTCPDCSSMVHLKSIKSHLLNNHQKYFLKEYDVEEVMDLIYNNNAGIVYFILNEEWCEFEWKHLTIQRYGLYIGLKTYSPNIKLGVIPSNLNFEPNNFTNVDLHEISSYKPYLTFIDK